jgi:hypothetical protein
MYLFLSICNFLYLILTQIIAFKIFKLKKNWFFVTFLLHSFISIYFLPKDFSILNILEYFFFNFLILTCYLVFLVLVFSGSPSITLLNNSNKKNFLKSGFMKHRLSLMRKDKLLTKRNQMTPRGKLVLHGTNLLSNIIFKEND